MSRVSGGLGVVIALLAGALPAQERGTLAARVAATSDRVVRFSAPARDGICGMGEGNVSRGDGAGRWRREASRYWDGGDACTRGPLRVVLERGESGTNRVRFFLGGQWRNDAPGIDLGDVSAPEAAVVLGDVVQHAPARPATDAMVPLTLLAHVDAVRPLLITARDATRPREVRKSAVFWLSQAAQDVVAPLGALATEDPDVEIRKQAVFGLSQRPTEEAVPALIRIADSRRDPEIRRTAIFWLGQKDDPRVLTWLEKALAPH
ncbi:MAG: HEAT repeat domain-containing protein [Gemmatimonadaceae bacterium]|jgi:hypothetical protein|nr:HEAT repeat domain-containing protein [Gemmatimonadaceae bacterium]